VMLWSFG